MADTREVFVTRLRDQLAELDARIASLEAERSVVLRHIHQASIDFGLVDPSFVNSPPVYGGQARQWWALQQACNNLDGEVCSVSDIVSQAVELGHQVDRNTASRTMRRRGDLWQPTDQRGLWKCLWKKHHLRRSPELGLNSFESKHQESWKEGS